MSTETSNEQEYFDKIKEFLSILHTGDPEHFLDELEALSNRFPNRAEVYFILGLVAYKKNDIGPAIDFINKAHEIDSQCREYADALASIYTKVGKLSDGLYFAKLATILDPHPEIQPLLPQYISDYFSSLKEATPSRHYVNAMYAFNRRNYLETIELAEKELRVNKHHGPCFTLLGQASMNICDFEHANDAFAAAVYLEPEHTNILLEQGKLFYHLGEYAKAVEVHKSVIEREPDNIDYISEIVSYSEYLDGEFSDAQNFFHNHLSAEAKKIESLLDDVEDSPRHPGEKITIGYICNTAFLGPEVGMIEAILRHHDLNRYNIRFYQQSILEDSVTSKLRMYVSSHRKIYDIEDETLAIIMKGDELDVLVDISSTSSGIRAKLMAMNIAPVQLSWLLPPFGINMPGNNFVFSDSHTIESDKKQLDSDQNSLFLDIGLMTTMPLEGMPAVVPPPATKNGGITFGGKCDLAVLTPSTISLWANVLKALPDSTLLLGNVITCTRLIRNLVTERFASEGITDQIEFWDSPVPDRVDGSFYNHIDIQLDPCNVSQYVNTIEALWMGLPTITLTGPRRSSQLSGSVLTSTSQMDWIAETSDQFVSIAQSLASDIDALEKTRKTLQEKLHDTAILQPRAFTQVLEKAYESALHTINS